MSSTGITSSRLVFASILKMIRFKSDRIAVLLHLLLFFNFFFKQNLAVCGWINWWAFISYITSFCCRGRSIWKWWAWLRLLVLRSGSRWTSLTEMNFLRRLTNGKFGYFFMTMQIIWVGANLPDCELFRFWFWMKWSLDFLFRNDCLNLKVIPTSLPLFVGLIFILHRYPSWDFWISCFAPQNTLTNAACSVTPTFIPETCHRLFWSSMGFIARQLFLRIEFLCILGNILVEDLCVLKSLR